MTRYIWKIIRGQMSFWRR